MEPYKIFLKVLHFVSVQGLVPFVLILLTPVRIVFDFFTITHPNYFKGPNSPFKHKKKVEDVQAQIKEWIKNGKVGRLCTGNPTWKSVHIKSLDKGSMTKISLDLDDIVEIDVENKVITVEPGMKIGTLTGKLIPLGWTIPVVPEIETLTIGGLICGAGLETSSHKYGAFSDTCLSYEVVLADGRCLTCSKDENPDIFYALPMSYGTLAFLTSAKIPLIPATRYVKLEYVHTDSLAEAQKLLEENKCEFVEGIMYAMDKIMIMFGTMVDGADPKKIKTFMRWDDAWFFKHVETYFQRPNHSVEYVPLRDYYHRHQRGLFWTVGAMMPYGNEPWFRKVFGWVYPINPQLGKLFRPKSATFLDFMYDSFVLQDFVVPMSKFREIIEMSHKEVAVYPLWLCPCKTNNSPANPRAEQTRAELYIDLGIYGVTTKPGYVMETVHRKFEKYTLANKGFQGLYTDTFLTREEFDQMFDMKLYHKVRRQLNCEDAFPEAYDKICRAAYRAK